MSIDSLTNLQSILDSKDGWSKTTTSDVGSLKITTGYGLGGQTISAGSG